MKQVKMIAFALIIALGACSEQPDTGDVGFIYTEPPKVHIGIVTGFSEGYDENVGCCGSHVSLFEMTSNVDGTLTTRYLHSKLEIGDQIQYTEPTEEEKKRGHLGTIINYTKH
jgi:hypothetical protein